MRVHLASITHKHGTNLYAGGSRAELMEKLARYCRDNDGNKLLDHSMPDEELFDAYFEAEHYGSNEWVEFDDSEEVLVDVTKLVEMLLQNHQTGMVEGSHGLHDAIEKAAILDQGGANRFYSISDELADCLTKDERVVRDLAGMTIWARVEG